MKKRTYTVTGATGRVGRAAATGLLDAGQTVRVVGRDPARLEPLVARGALPYVGNIHDALFVERAFDGADAALLIASGDRRGRDYRASFGRAGANYADAARKTGLRKAVFISTIGAHDERYRGFFMIHGDVEESLDAVAGLDVLHLRAPQFFENLFYFLPASQARGALCSPIDPDVRLDMARTTEVAALAVRHLLELRFEGKTALELHGKEPLTLRGVAGLLSKELGRPFPAERVPRETNIEAMIAAGMRRDFSTLITDTWDVFSQHGFLRAPEPRAAVVATTPIEDFLRSEFIPALKASP